MVISEVGKLINVIKGYLSGEIKQAVYHKTKIIKGEFFDRRYVRIYIKNGKKKDTLLVIMYQIEMDGSLFITIEKTGSYLESYKSTREAIFFFAEKVIKEC